MMGPYGYGAGPFGPVQPGGYYYPFAPAAMGYGGFDMAGAVPPYMNPYGGGMSGFSREEEENKEDQENEN